MIVCGACGHENPDSGEFCQSCGRFLEYTRRPDPDQPQARAPERPAPPPPGPQTLREPVVTITPPSEPARPGEALIVTARIRNASTIVDRVSVTIVGPSAAWWKIEPASVSLYPGTEAEIRLELRPPRGPDLVAGSTSVGLQAKTDPPDVRMSTAQFDVVIEARPEVTTELIPRTSRGRRTGRHVVTVTNRGNAPWQASVRAVDPDARLRLRVQPETLEVAAGSRANVRVVAGGSFNFVGPTDATSFIVELRPVDGGPPITHEARFEQASLFRTVPLAVMGGLAAVIIVVLAALSGWVKLPPQATPTPSATGATPSPTATSAASATPTVASVQPSVTPEVTPTAEVTPTPPSVADWAQQWADELGLGSPVGVTVPVDDRVGQFQAFESGVVYLRPDGKAWPIRGDILGKWGCLLDLGEGVNCLAPGGVPAQVVPVLGYPTDAERLDQANEPFQRFDHGGIYCYQGCGSIIYEPLDPVWQTLSGTLGTPIRDQIQTDQFNNAFLGRFVNGFLMVSPETSDWIACGYDGRVISSSGIQSDCTGWAAYVKSLGD